MSAKKSRAVHGDNRGRLTGTRRELESSPLIITQWRYDDARNQVSWFFKISL